MEIRSVLVFLRVGAACAARLEVAAALAARKGAALRAVIACDDPMPPVADSFAIGAQGVGEAISHRQTAIEAAVAPLRAALNAVASRHGLTAQAVVAAPEDSPQIQAMAARLADLAVLGLARGAERALAEAAILDGGAPCLLVPEPPADSVVPIASGAFPHVALAWDGSREARRALADGFGFLKAARRVSVLTVDGEAAAGGIIDFLTLHGLAAEFHDLGSAGHGPGGALMAWCAESGVDLLVMGAYGRPRAIERMLGGATRSLLESARGVVLVSH